jgi:hypothetical protein
LERQHLAQSGHASQADERPFSKNSGHDVRKSEKNDSVDGGLTTMSVIKLNEGQNS